MAIERVYALRGATTIETNSEAQITERTVELIEKIFASNALDADGKSIVNCIFSTTADITADYPARAVRESGMITAPVFSCTEPSIEGALPLCIRAMITVADCAETPPPRHVYLHGAVCLRPDLAEKK